MKRSEAVSSTSEHPISYTFTYDESGRPYSVHRESIYNSNALSEFYYYMTNLQGDVIKILDYDKNVVANYSYDAWGRVIAVTDANGNAITNENHIGNTNPLRYRGYMYDTETKLYYCNSRYYDPQVKRFINADSYASTGTGFLGYNMYTYCNNNPVMYSDPSGQEWVSIRKFVEERGGIAIWESTLRIAIFQLNGINMVLQANGNNIYGLGATNEKGRMKANDYDLAYYFEVKDWATYFLGFEWFADQEGFKVWTIQYFASKSFCMDFAENIISMKGENYCGMSVKDIAIECYAHRVIYEATEATIHLFNRGWSDFRSAEYIGLVANDPNKGYYSVIWDLGGLINPKANSNIFNR